MKKLLLTFSLAVAMLAANAQKVIITGLMYDPQGADAPALGVANTGDHVNKGGYEYIQLMATEDITFSPTNAICVVRCTNSGITSGAPDKGWAETNNTRTYMFKVTSGTVAKGEFFYVGGPDMTAGGYLLDGSVWYPILDMSSTGTNSKWLRPLAYSNNTNATGDDNIGIANTGLFVNSVGGSSARPQGVAVFATSSINVNSVPIDAIFVGYSNSNVLAGNDEVSTYNAANLPANGYKVPATDRYTAGYIGDANNRYVFNFQPSTDKGFFLKLGGVFDVGTHTWATQRSTNYVQLVPTTGTIVERAAFATLAMIEGNAIGAADGEVAVEATKVINSLPVTLTTFTAKATKQGTVNLNWATASEQDNSHFEINRSADATNFTKIGEVAGNGTSNTTKNYNYTDNSPVGGVNYYQLKQVDFDGKSALSGVVSAKVGLSQNNVSVSANKSAVTVSYKALATGKATFTVYSVSGAKLASVTQNVNVGVNQVNIPVQLGSSLHLLQVQQAGEGVSVKF